MSDLSLACMEEKEKERPHTSVSTRIPLPKSGTLLAGTPPTIYSLRILVQPPRIQPVPSRHALSKRSRYMYVGYDSHRVDPSEQALQGVFPGFALHTTLQGYFEWTPRYFRDAIFTVHHADYQSIGGVGAAEGVCEAWQVRVNSFHPDFETPFDHTHTRLTELTGMTWGRKVQYCHDVRLVLEFGTERHLLAAVHSNFPVTAEHLEKSTRKSEDAILPAQASRVEGQASLVELSQVEDLATRSVQIGRQHNIDSDIASSQSCRCCGYYFCGPRERRAVVVSIAPSLQACRTLGIP